MGNGSISDVEKPTKVKYFDELMGEGDDYYPVQIKAANFCTSILTQGGKLFIWGENV